MIFWRPIKITWLSVNSYCAAWYCWQPMKRKWRHFDEMFVAGFIKSCQNDNFLCRKWQKFRQNDDHISVSVPKCTSHTCWTKVKSIISSRNITVLQLITSDALIVSYAIIGSSSTAGFLLIWPSGTNPSQMLTKYATFRSIKYRMLGMASLL